MAGKNVYDQKPKNYGSTGNRNQKKNFRKLLILEAVIICIAVAGFAYLVLRDKDKSTESQKEMVNSGQNAVTDTNVPDRQESNNTSTPSPSTTPDEEDSQDKEEAINQKIQELIAQADRLALGYDYDGAIDLIKSFGDNYTDYDSLTEAIAGYEKTKESLDPLGAYDSIDQISHIFFHSLVADPSKAFDGDADSNGYNYYMTTVDEFKSMMESMYEQGYVIVSIHDVAKKVKGEDGKEKYVAGDIMLPPDKKPFVISQDDVNYYDYMTGDGFARRIIIDENGIPTTEMVMDDGTVSIGEYDMVPILESFIEKHPDFSYKGAKGIIALTGYEGALGYRTNDPSSPTYEQDKEAVKKVAQVMKERGWEFASHSYGHRDMGKATVEFTKKDSDRWMKEVGSLIGPTDIYIFPYGIDIETTMGHYSSDKFKYLKKLGFEYYCGVYKDPWIQVKDDYVRMTRRPLDGQAMLQFPERLKDLFDVSKIVDKSRPALK